MNRLPVKLKNHLFEPLLTSRDKWGDLTHKARPRVGLPFEVVCGLSYVSPTLRLLFPHEVVFRVQEAAST